MILKRGAITLGMDHRSIRASRTIVSYNSSERLELHHTLSDELSVPDFMDAARAGRLNVKSRPG